MNFKIPLSSWLLLLLSACGRPSDSPSGHVWRGQTSRIRTFDPARAADLASAQAVSRVYEGLLQYAYLDRPYRVEPLLAESLPEVSPDGLIYTFRLRRGIFFQDDPCFRATGGRGRELEAADVVYSLMRLADAKTASTGYWAFRDRVEGLDAFRAVSAGPEPTDYRREVAGLRATDRYTVQMKLLRPYPQWLWILAMPYAAVVAREAVEYYGRDFDQHPVGTGPFVLKSHRPNYRVEFIRNPKWAETGRVENIPPGWSPTGETLPFLDRMVQYVIGDPATAWLMFLDGRLESSTVSRDNWDAVFPDGRRLSEPLRARGIQVVESPTLDIFYIGFNQDDPVVGPNRRLRQAMTCAFDFEEWSRFYNGRVVRATGPIPPGLAVGGGEGSFFFDLERARRLLAEAGYPEGRDPKTGRRLVLTLEIGQADNPEIRQSTDLFIQFMDRLGVIIEPRYHNWPTFLGRLERRQAQMFRLSWIADYPDAENFLQLFYGPNASPGSNRSNYHNPEFDRLYEEARVLPDSPARTALYRQMQEIIREDCPWIFTHHARACVLLQPWVRNYRYHDFPCGMEKYYAVSLNLEP